MRLAVRLAVVPVTALAVVGAAAALPAAAATAGPAGGGDATDGSRPTSSALGGTGKPSRGSALSPRLQRLTQPALASAPPSVAARSLWTAASGPGSLARTRAGELLVEVRTLDTSADTVAALASTGARVVHVASTTPMVTLAVEPGALEAVAAVPGVEYVSEVLEPMRNAACPTGIVSEGVAQLRVDTARTSFPAVTGAGVTVGVLSDSYDELGGAAADVVAGELPGVGNTCGSTTPVSVLADDAPPTNSDEGRAMAQIVHDIAPGAAISFATAFTGEQAFADNIRALAAAGADVIVDDISYFNEPMYQDGVIAKAVADVTAAGVTYLSSAANSNVIGPSGDFGSYEAPAFRPTTCPAAIKALSGYGSASCHDFNPGPGVDSSQFLTLDGKLSISLGWNEPQGGITTDFDLCAIDPTNGSVAGCADDYNISESKRAFEFLSGNWNGALALVIVRYAGTSTPRLKWISNRSELIGNEYGVSSGGDVVGPTAFGHNVSRDTVSVAAVAYDDATKPEEFSSRGPALTCWGPVVGAAPAAALPGGCQGSTIDVAATDGTANSFFGEFVSGVWRFYGTSAAAPHAAGVAALLRQKSPSFTTTQLLANLKSTSRPVGAFGVNAIGAGLLDARAALAAPTPLAPTAAVSAPVSPVTLATSVLVRWNAVPPAGTTISSYQLQRALKTPAGVLGAYADLGGPRTSTSLAQPTAAGTTACYRVRATASNGMVSPASAARCTTVPLDDRALGASRAGWIRAKSASAYLRTTSISTRVGSTLTLKAARGSRLAVVVTKQPGGGTIGVYVKGRRVATIPTAARRAAPRTVVNLAVRTAGLPVVLRVDRRGTRGVSVDGVAVLP